MIGDPHDVPISQCFLPIFRVFFLSVTEVWADSSVAHRNLNVFLFFWGGPLKTHKKKEKKNMCLKKHMYVNTNGQALGESESSESCQESAM